MYKLKYANVYGVIIDANKLKNAHITHSSDTDKWSIDFDGTSYGYKSEEDAKKELDEILKLKGELPMWKTVGSDMKAFISEHKSTIYWIAVLFLADHFLFGGAFRDRLQGIMNKLLGKVEAQVDGKPVTLVPPGGQQQA